MHKTILSAAAMALALLLTLAGCGSTGEGPEPAPAQPETQAPRPSAPATGQDQTAAPQPPAPGTEAIDVSAELQQLEQEFEARVGVSALDTSTGGSVEYRSGERFGFASTLKVFAAAEFLRQVPPDRRDTRITWTADDVAAAGYSPVAAEHTADGLTLNELAEAAVRDSDNTAMNLVLDEIGGPEGLQRGLADVGDSTTRVTDREPELNQVEPNGTDNTTTPAAFTANLRALLDPQDLPHDDRDILIEWMSANATGDALVRAGAPADWVVADKSGGAGAMRNDVAVVTPPGGEPILLTVLTEKNDPAAAYDDALVARTAEIVLSALQ